MSVNSTTAERIRAHFRGLGMQSVEVAEWGDGGKPLKVHWKPVTLTERGNALEAGKRPLAFYAALVCAKALNEDGTRIFTEHDRHVLANEASAEVVMRVGLAMLNTSDESALGE